ncbi:hypothetical protein [Paraburkholderia bannensis]|uniref:hypothetical protein n=1 Tax=Paraburkholderia bannensis TaxID=765414 RepID=UPI002AB744BC|nr:hypothetical protein [Paraburkholderia bannensis]
MKIDLNSAMVDISGAAQRYDAADLFCHLVSGRLVPLEIAGIAGIETSWNMKRGFAPSDSFRAAGTPIRAGNS